MGKNNVQWVNQRTKWAIFNSKLLVYQRVHPPNHHFYRWYLYHSQSWVVYGIVLPTLIIHHILWDEAHERTIRPDGPSATSWLASSSSGASVQKLMHLPSDRNPWNWYENGMKMVGKYMKIYENIWKKYENISKWYDKVNYTHHWFFREWFDEFLSTGSGDSGDPAIKWGEHFDMFW